MILKEFLKEVHHRIEAKERTRISQSIMAERIGVSHRTYLEYHRGTNEPISMKAVLNLLSQLDEQDLITVMHVWNQDK